MHIHMHMFMYMHIQYLAWSGERGRGEAHVNEYKVSSSTLVENQVGRVARHCGDQN